MRYQGWCQYALTGELQKSRSYESCPSKSRTAVFKYRMITLFDIMSTLNFSKDHLCERFILNVKSPDAYGLLFVIQSKNTEILWTVGCLLTFRFSPLTTVIPFLQYFYRRSYISYGTCIPTIAKHIDTFPWLFL
jgi:hypothetical protein